MTLNAELELEDLEILDVPPYSKSDPSKININANGYVDFAGRKVATEIDFKEVIFFVVARYKKSPDDTSLIIIPNLKEGVDPSQTVKWQDNKGKKLLNLHPFMRQHGLKEGVLVDYELLSYKGKPAIRLFTIPKPAKEKSTSTKKKVDTPQESPPAKRKYKKRTPKAAAESILTAAAQPKRKYKKRTPKAAAQPKSAQTIQKRKGAKVVSGKKTSKAGAKKATKPGK